MLSGFNLNYELIRIVLSVWFVFTVFVILILAIALWIMRDR